MKNMRIKALVLATTMLLSTVVSVGATDYSETFSDMPDASYWSAEALTAAIDNGLIQGNDGQINPEGNLTRAEMATIMNRALSTSRKADVSDFSDVTTSDWYYEEIQKAVFMGAFTGNGNGTMGADSAITREEAFVVLARVILGTTSDYSSLEQFTDEDEISEWAKSSLAFMVENGYVNGADGELNPQDNITREEFAQVMMNVVSVYSDESVIEDTVIDGNIVLTNEDITLTNVTINGDLIIADSVDNGDVYLDNVTINGRLVARGGGSNSIILSLTTVVANGISASKNVKGDEVEQELDDVAPVNIVYQNEEPVDLNVFGNTVATITGIFNTATAVDGTSTTTLKEGTVSESVVIEETATGSDFIIETGVTVSTVDVSAADASISGAGEVLNVVITEDSASVGLTIGGTLIVATIEIAAPEATVTVAESAVVETVKSTETATGSSVTVAGEASVAAVEVAAVEATVTVTETATVETVTKTETATGSSLAVSGTANVATVETYAESSVVEVSESGTIGSTTAYADNVELKSDDTATFTEVVVEGNDVSVNANASNVTVSDSSTGTTSGDTTLESGTTTEVVKPEETTTEDTTTEDTTTEDTTTEDDTTTDDSTSSGGSSSTSYTYYLEINFDKNDGEVSNYLKAKQSGSTATLVSEMISMTDGEMDSFIAVGDDSSYNTILMPILMQYVNDTALVADLQEALLTMLEASDDQDALELVVCEDGVFAADSDVEGIAISITSDSGDLVRLLTTSTTARSVRTDEIVVTFEVYDEYSEVTDVYVLTVSMYRN